MRIVSLLPSATEIVCALGLESSLVAVSHECDYPPSVKRLPTITTSILPESLDSKAIDEAVVEAVKESRALYEIDGDLLLDLKPDLIVTQGLCDVCAVTEGTVERTLNLLPQVLPDGVQTLSLTGTVFEGILRDIRQVGQATDTRIQAETLVDVLRSRWHALQERRQTEGAVWVAMLEWTEPPFFGGHWVPEMVAVAGGRSVWGRPGEASGRLNRSDLSRSPADLLVVMACGFDLDANIGFARDLYRHAQWRHYEPIRNQQVYACNANAFFSRPGPRVVRGAELLATIIEQRAEIRLPGEAAYVPDLS